MKKPRLVFVLACLSGGIVIPALSGCGDQAPPMTAADKANFKGGPMPASAAKIMAEKMREANARKGAPAAGTP